MQPDVSERTEVVPLRLGRYIGTLLLAWLIPGSGHLLLRRWGQAIIVFMTVHFMFLYGLFMGSPIHRFRPESPIQSTLEKAAQMCAGSVYWLTAWLLPRMRAWADTPVRRWAERSEFGAGDRIHAWAEKGHVFTLSAGLLNLLMVLKVRDLLYRTMSETQPEAADADAAVPSEHEESSDVA